MRTTLDIDDDVLRAAKDLARREKKTAGKIISDLARKALGAVAPHPTAREAKALYGVRPFPRARTTSSGQTTSVCWTRGSPTRAASTGRAS